MPRPSTRDTRLAVGGCPGVRVAVPTTLRLLGLPIELIGMYIIVCYWNSIRDTDLLKRRGFLDPLNWGVHCSPAVKLNESECLLVEACPEGNERRKELSLDWSGCDSSSSGENNSENTYFGSLTLCIRNNGIEINKY